MGLLSLLSRPLITILSICNRLRPTQPILIKFRLRGSVIHPGHVVVPCQVRLTHVSMELRHGRHFNPLLIRPSVLTMVFPFRRPLCVKARLVSARRNFCSLLYFLFGINRLFVISNLRNLSLLLRLPSTLVLINGCPLRVYGLFFVPHKLKIIRRHSSPFCNFHHNVRNRTFRFINLSLPPHLYRLHFNFYRFFFLLPPLFISDITIYLYNSLLYLRYNGICHRHFFLSSRHFSLFNRFVFASRRLTMVLLHKCVFNFQAISTTLRSMFNRHFNVNNLVNFRFIPYRRVINA